MLRVGSDSHFCVKLPDHLQTGKKGDKNMYMFAANSQVEMENWIRALKRGVFVRRVSVCMMALPALSNEQVLSLEGIFRLAGDRGLTKNIENGIDKGNFSFITTHMQKLSIQSCREPPPRTVG